MSLRRGLSHADNDIPQGVRVVHRYMKSGSGFATCRDLVLLQVGDGGAV